VNISIENLAPCKQLIRVDVPEETVKQKMDVITGEFRRQANLPGFRAGKAPKHMVIKSYGDRIEQEVRKDLVNEGYRKAIKDNDLHTVGNPDVEEIQFGQDLPFQFAVTVETAPTFELPDYKGIKIQKEIRSVTDEDIDAVLTTGRPEKGMPPPFPALDATARTQVIAYFKWLNENRAVLISESARIQAGRSVDWSKLPWWEFR